MKLIQVGLGDFGLNWLKDILLKNNTVQLIGVVDKNDNLLNSAKELSGMEDVLIFNDLKDALAKLKPDFILNVTPPGIHKEINFIAFENKIPVLSEKPIAEIYSDAKEILEKSIEVNVPIMISENYRYSNYARTAKKIISSGDLGRIDSVSVDFNRKHIMTNYHKDLEHPLLLDVSIHHIDMIRYITGSEAKTVFAKSWTPEWSWYKGYSNVQLLLDLENNIKVSYRGSLSAYKSETDWSCDWRIEGEKGILKMSNGTINVYKNEGDLEIKVAESYDSREFVLNEFIESLTNNRPGETNIIDNIRNFEIVDAAIRSLTTSNVIKL